MGSCWCKRPCSFGCTRDRDLRSLQKAKFVLSVVMYKGRKDMEGCLRNLERS